MTLRLQIPGTRRGVLTGASICVLALALTITVYPQQAKPTSRKTTPALRELGLSVPRDILLQIVEVEDKRLSSNNLSQLLAHENPSVRKRAALAAGRIGDEHAVPALVSLLENDKDDDVRAMAAFALGEIETPAGAAALIVELTKRDGSKIRGRVIEALGKITAALAATDKAPLTSFQKEIYNALEFEASRRSAPETEVILLTLTAALRARPEGVGKVIAEFLTYDDPRIRADAANALARLRAKDGNNQLRKLLTTDPDPIVRANAARVLGTTEDKDAFDSLLDRALNDADQRVRVSAIRALASLREPKAALPLLKRGQQLKLPANTNEILEIVTTLGRVSQSSKDQATREWLQQLRNLNAPEVEIALARINPQSYQMDLQRLPVTSDWHYVAAVFQGAAELVNVKTGNPVLDASIKTETLRILTSDFSCPPMIVSRVQGHERLKPDTVVGTSCEPLPTKALPDWLRALAAFKSPETEETIGQYLDNKDTVVRATAAELLAELPPDQINETALVKSLPAALEDRKLNDAALAILDALAKHKTPAVIGAIKTALDSSDHLIRRRAVALLKANGVGDFSARIGTVQTRNSRADYERAISRAGKNVRAIVSTSKGAFTIELLPNEAPLTVDSFIQLSRRGYFKNIAFHRVVPNFVIQGGDPRGDGNGGPGYQIRCEINQISYERGAVGMALSGKDTGGSQWFVTHSRQPHLDGGYTVFGRVIAGMDVVDRIVRGDLIRSIVINEGVGPDVP
jgi:cyclophilin family peptidyl-prolyl cis-trans isomerase/HEAT repeat protein